MSGVQPLRTFALWAPVLCYMGAIFAASSSSAGPDLPVRVWDKAGHAVVYGGLALLLLRALTGGWARVVTPLHAWGAAAGTVAYGVTDEWHQAYVPGRTADPWDLAADAIGAICCVGIWYVRSRFARGRTL